MLKNTFLCIDHQTQDYQDTSNDFVFEVLHTNKMFLCQKYQNVHGVIVLRKSSYDSRTPECVQDSRRQFFLCLFILFLMDGLHYITFMLKFSLVFYNLRSNHLTSAGLEDLALAPGGLNGGTGSLCESVGLNGNVLGGELVASDNNLVGVVLGLGDGLGLEKGFEIAGRSGGDSIKRIQLDQVVCLLGVSGSHRSALELGQPAVERVLSSLESGSGGSTAAGLLSTHSETAGGTLSGGDTASLAALGLAGSGGGAEVVEGELEVFDIVDVGLIGLAALPVVELHGKPRGGSGDRGKGSRFGNK